MKTKKIQKPFSIEAWKNGAKVETRDGRSARIICTDLNSIYSIAAAITNNDGEEHTDEYDTDGHYVHGQEDVCDLVIVEEVEEVEEPERWADDKEAKGEGWFISRQGVAAGVEFAKTVRLNDCFNYHAFATEEQAKSALAMARISQLMEHDERYGGVVTEDEWNDSDILKWILVKRGNSIFKDVIYVTYNFLAFHTDEQRKLFLFENEQLVKDYLMID